MATLAISCVTDIELGEIMMDGQHDFHRGIVVHSGPTVDVIRLQSDQKHRLSFPIDADADEIEELRARVHELDKARIRAGNQITYLRRMRDRNIQSSVIRESDLRKCLDAALDERDSVIQVLLKQIDALDETLGDAKGFASRIIEGN